MEKFQTQSLNFRYEMLNELQYTDCYYDFGLGICGIIVEYVMETRGPDMLRNKIFNIAHTLRRQTFLAGFYFDSAGNLVNVDMETVIWHRAMPDIEPGIYTICASQLPWSSNIQVTFQFPTYIKSEDGDILYELIMLTESPQSVFDMFIGRGKSNKLIELNDGIKIPFDRIIDFLSNEKYGCGLLNSVVADDAAELARFRIAAGRIAFRDCDLPCQDVPYDVDMFITKDVLDQKNAARLDIISAQFPTVIAYIIDNYAVDQDFVADDIMYDIVIPDRPSLSCIYASFPDPEDSKAQWTIELNYYQPIYIIYDTIASTSRHKFPFYLPNLPNFIMGMPIWPGSRDMIDTCRCAGIYENTEKTNPDLLDRIVERMRKAFRDALNPALNRDMRHMMRMSGVV